MKQEKRKTLDAIRNKIKDLLTDELLTDAGASNVVNRSLDFCAISREIIDNKMFDDKIVDNYIEDGKNMIVQLGGTLDFLEENNNVTFSWLKSRFLRVE